MSIDPVTSLLDVGKSIIERIWPDPAAQAEQMFKLQELAQKGNLAEMQAHVTILQGQMAINMEEAKHKSIFVAGWRPFVGWIGGFSLAYASIVEPLMRFITTGMGWVQPFPGIDTNLTMQVLFGMLGIAGMRSYDKKNSVQTDKI